MPNKASQKYQFSGHETFPLRQLWPMKAVKLANAMANQKKSLNLSSEQTMIWLGIGKNMVSSLSYWTKTAGLLTDQNKPTELGQSLFGSADGRQGFDPYCESPNTAWLIHWNLATSEKNCTAFWYVFNHVSKIQFTRADLIDDIMSFVAKNDFKTTENTVKRAVEVCLRSYIPNVGSRSKVVSEEFVDPLLGDLGLIQTKFKEVFSIERHPRPTLPSALFGYFVLDYWEKYSSQTSSLELSRLMYDVNSPGKIFCLDENSLVSYLESLEELTQGRYIWSDQAGIRTLRRRLEAPSTSANLKTELLRFAYTK